nr:hypothetical protein GCM10025699_66950 [Microbacterium flavescens]
MAEATSTTHPTSHASPFVEIDREAWAELAPATRLPLTETEIVQLRGLGDRLDMREVQDVYVPLSRLLNLYAAGARICTAPPATSSASGRSGPRS